MVSAVLGDRVKVTTATTSTGTLTLGAVFSNAFCTFAEAGITNGQTVTYCIEEGSDFEIGRGVYTSAGTTLTRATVLLSKIGGTAGTSKMNLAGTATVRIIAAKEDLDVNDFDEDTSPDGTVDYHWMHDASATLKKKVKPQNIFRTGGWQLLNSGSVSSAATLDIVLSSYTSFTRGLKLILNTFVPATDDVELWALLSTNAGSSYDNAAGNYQWALTGFRTDNISAVDRSASDTKIRLLGHTNATASVSNTAAEGGATCEVWLPDQTNTGVWPRVISHGAYWGAGALGAVQQGFGQRVTAQDTDAIRIQFESGNIASGTWGLYGLA